MTAYLVIWLFLHNEQTSSASPNSSNMLKRQLPDVVSARLRLSIALSVVLNRTRRVIASITRPNCLTTVGLRSGQNSIPFQAGSLS